MARRPQTPVQPSPPPRLTVSRDSARESILSRVEIGKTIRDRQISGRADYEEAQAQARKWHEYNKELLRRMFDTEEYHDRYSSAGSQSVYFAMEPDFGRDVRDFRKTQDDRINYLESLAERLDLIEEPFLERGAPLEPEPRARIETKSRAESRRVFVVHGRDEEAKAIVARFLEKCRLEPIILHEQADQGRTIIEKFEASADVSFAVVLLTPDDVGGLKPPAGEAPTLNDRPRQNVVLELGYFLGALGRQRVVALKRGDMELPSDFAGVIYTPLDSAEAWKMKLAKEIKAAGIDVDLNEALG